MNFQISLWFIRGKERIEISSDKITFIRSNGILKLKKQVLISDIENVSISPKTDPSNGFVNKRRQLIKEMIGAIFFWYNMGRIDFKIKNNYKSFFNGMTDNQANETVAFLLKYFNKLK